MRGAKPTVLTVRRRALMPMPAGSVSAPIALTSRGKLASGSPMPMKTTLETAPCAPAWSTCATISAAVRLRATPSNPDAQNAHAIPHPIWLETHTVWRSPSRMETASTSSPSCARNSSLAVRPSGVGRRRCRASGVAGSSASSRPRTAAGRSVIPP